MAQQTDVVRLRVEEPVEVDLRRVEAAFGRDAASWLGEPIQDDASGRRQYVGDLELAIDFERRFTFRKSTIFTLGTPVATASGYTVPVEWRAATLAPLFPVFVGRLTLTASSISLDGFYAPPFGPLGPVADRAILGAGARRVARWFLRSIIEAIDSGS